MDDNKHNDQFNASLQLPGDPEPKLPKPDPTADLIRKRVEAAYGHEPDLEQEAEEVEELRPKARRTRHQEFIYNLTNSGRPLHEIQAAWHEYYAGLTDSDKHQVWQEFYNTQSQESHHPAVIHPLDSPRPSKPAISPREPFRPKPKIVLKPPRLKHRLPRPATTKKSAANQTLHSLLFGLGTGSIVMIVFLFSFFNERIISPFIQPSRNVSNTPIINGTAVNPNPEVIIPKINVEIPVVYDVNTIDETQVEKGLERGVVHYADTATPGQNGNVVIVGHSSNNILNGGKYKFAFVLLHDLTVGDTFYLQKDGKRYTYQVYERRVVKPSDVSVLGLADKPATATLITCDPPGTSNNRLVVTAEQIDPDPITNAAQTTQNKIATSSAVVPGSSPTLWSRLVKWFEQ